MLSLFLAIFFSDCWNFFPFFIFFSLSFPCSLSLARYIFSDCWSSSFFSSFFHFLSHALCHFLSAPPFPFLYAWLPLEFVGLSGAGCGWAVDRGSWIVGLCGGSWIVFWWVLILLGFDWFWWDLIFVVGFVGWSEWLWVLVVGWSDWFWVGVWFLWLGSWIDRSDFGLGLWMGMGYGVGGGLILGWGLIFVVGFVGWSEWFWVGVVDGYGLRCWWRIDFGLGFTVMEGRWVSGFWLMVGMVCGGGG